MQLGTRWSAGGTPPAGLPDEVVQRIRAVDAGLPPQELGVARWTLTWLERRPVAELDLGTLVTVDHDGSVQVRQLED